MGRSRRHTDYRRVGASRWRLKLKLGFGDYGRNWGGIFVYDNDQFFPVDEKGVGNQGRNHNFHFTTEIRGGFAYKGGEKFTFKGDDDVWVFVNGKLAIDIGGIHGKETATIDFDAKAQELGIASTVTAFGFAAKADQAPNTTQAPTNGYANFMASISPIFASVATT